MANPYHILETKGDLYYEVENGDQLIIKVKPEVLANAGGGEPGGGGSDIYIIKEYDATTPTDYNVFSSLRTLKEIRQVSESAENKFLRRDIPDTKYGTLFINDSIQSKIFIDGYDGGKGWQITNTGSAWMDFLRVRTDEIVGGNIGSDVFMSGFLTGKGWNIGPFYRTNAAGIEEKKWRLEIDDAVIRGSLRVYEMIISQLRGENDNVIFAGMMKVDHYDSETGRIYIQTDDGILYNTFREGDVLMVQRFNGMPSLENDYYVTKQYELRVTEVGVGNLADGKDRLDWIKFSNFVGDMDLIDFGDVLTRVDNVINNERKGIVMVTTIDAVAPRIDVVYGLKTNPDTAVKARVGNLSGIRLKSGETLNNVWGIFGDGAIFQNSKIYLNDGKTVEQTFEVYDGKLNSAISELKDSMVEEKGNILLNSAFNDNLLYWTSTNDIAPIKVGQNLLWFNLSYYVVNNQIADIISDNGRSVLRLKNSTITQPEELYNFIEEDREGAYSFSLFYRAITPGILKVGVAGSTLYKEQSIEPSDKSQRLNFSGDWNGTGSFSLSYDGEIYIHSLSLFNDALANATIKLQTQITQNSEQIALRATKDYVDSETGEVYTHFEGVLSVTAEQISAVNTRVDNVNQTISEAGWVTTADAVTLFAQKTDITGDKIVSYINIQPSSIKIEAKNINLVGAITFNSFNSDVQNTINEKVNSSSLGSIAYQSSIAYSNLESQLKAMLDDAATENFVLEQVSNRVTTNQMNQKESQIYTNLVANAILDQGVLIGGYLKMSLIDVDNLYATSLSAVRGTIGGWTIENNALKIAAAASAKILVEPSGNRFLRINDTVSSLLYIRADGVTGINIYTQDTTGVCLSVIAQTGGMAISSYGNSKLIGRYGEAIEIGGYNTKIQGLRLYGAMISDATILAKTTSLALLSGSSSYIVTLPDLTSELLDGLDDRSSYGRFIMIKNIGTASKQVRPYNSSQDIIADQGSVFTYSSPYTLQSNGDASLFISLGYRWYQFKTPRDW